MDMGNIDGNQEVYMSVTSKKVSSMEKVNGRSK